MLTKSDTNTIKTIIREALSDVVTTKDLKPIKDDIHSLKQDVSGLKQDVSTLKTDVSVLKGDMKDVKKNLEELTDLTKEGIGELLVWSDEIHRDIVKEKLPERMRRLEKSVFHSAS